MTARTDIAIYKGGFMIMWQVKNIDDLIVFESESYKECIDYISFFKKSCDDVLYLDYKVVIWG